MNSRLRILNYVLIGLLVILSSIFIFQGNKNKRELRKEKHAASILNESNEKLKKELAALHGDFTKNSKQYNDIISANEKTISENNTNIQRLISDNRSGENAKKKVKELENNNRLLQTDIDIAKNQNDQFRKQSDMLNNQIADLTAKISNLEEKIELMKKLRSDNISISAKKGKRSKLTILAARTNVISATLDVPASSSNNLHYAVVFPGGTKIQSRDMPNSEIRLEPGMSDAIPADEYRTAYIKFEPRQKLKKGTYKLLVYSGNDYLTGMYINLK